MHDLIAASADTGADRPALYQGDRRVSYGELAAAVSAVANGLQSLGVGRRDRVAVFLPKSVETVAAIFGTSLAGGIFVPINPVLKAAQVAHILRDSGARVLITAAARLDALEAALPDCPELKHIVLVDGGIAGGLGGGSEDGARSGGNGGIGAHRSGQPEPTGWDAFIAAPPVLRRRRVIDGDIAAILYTSGSTGKPKGVVLSQRNMVAGACSVAEYLRNGEDDRLLAVLPFSFDYGFSQLSTAFLTGASVALIEYLLPRDIVRALQRYEITGLAAVPPLWIQLAALDWPAGTAGTLRYITNSGGAMPQATLAKLREKLPATDVFLMYGLTEAFRSTYLPPDQVAIRPTSIGKAIPNAEVLVARPDGGLCAPGEPGELVHRGALVSLGYWNDRAQTELRFRPAPAQPSELALPELAVWSGDTVVMDDEGYLYFVGRRDEMIKTSGYRVSPTEIEEAVYSTGLVAEAIAFGVPHPVQGSAIVVVGVANGAAGDGKGPPPTQALLAECRQALPNYMVPTHVEWRESLPRNANGKIDRPAIAAGLKHLFDEVEA